MSLTFHCESSLPLTLVALAFWTLQAAGCFNALWAVSARIFNLNPDSFIYAELLQSDVYYSQGLTFKAHLFAEFIFSEITEPILTSLLIMAAPGHQGLECLPKHDDKVSI